MTSRRNLLRAACVLPVFGYRHSPGEPHPPIKPKVIAYTANLTIFNRWLGFSDHTAYPIQMMFGTDLHWVDGKLTGLHPGTGEREVLKIIDSRGNGNRNVMRFNPEEIKEQHCPVFGDKFLVWAVPDLFRRLTLNTHPVVMINAPAPLLYAAAAGHDFRFDPGELTPVYA